MALQDPEKGRDVAARVVDYFGAGNQAPAKKHAAHSDEWLRVAEMRDLLDARDDSRGEQFLAADVWRCTPMWNDYAVVGAHQIVTSIDGGAAL